MRWLKEPLVLNGIIGLQIWEQTNFLKSSSLACFIKHLPMNCDEDSIEIENLNKDQKLKQIVIKCA